MNLSFIKLDAKKRLVNNNLKCFFISILPYVTIILLSVLNYYLYILLSKSDFTILPYASLYAEYIKPTLLTVSIVLSLFIWRAVRLCTDRFFFVKSRNHDIGFFASLKKLPLRSVCTYFLTCLLKLFLSIAWAALYFSPCVIVAGTFAYCLVSGNYGLGMLATLAASSLVLLVIGTVFLYVTLKRYSMCSAVIFSQKEKDSLKVIEKSISIMNGNMFRYSLYCMSFVGWVLSCVFVLPAFYVLPYRMMAKYSFFDCVTNSRPFEQTKEKPIIFYLAKE